MKMTRYLLDMKGLFNCLLNLVSARRQKQLILMLSERTYYVKFGMDEGDTNCLIPFEFKPQKNEEYTFIYKALIGQCSIDTSEHDDEIRFYLSSAKKHLPSKQLGSVLPSLIEDIGMQNIKHDWRRCDYWENRPNILSLLLIHYTHI